MGRARGQAGDATNDDVFARVVGHRRGTPDRPLTSPQAYADAIEITFTRRLAGAPVRVVEVNVLQTDEPGRSAGTAFVRIACPSLDDCDIAQARLSAWSTTTAEEWRTGWKAMDHGWLSLRLFDPTPD